MPTTVKSSLTINDTAAGSYTELYRCMPAGCNPINLTKTQVTWPGTAESVCDLEVSRHIQNMSLAAFCQSGFLQL